MEPPQTLALAPELKWPISVVCFKWGAPYPAEYVNVLQRAVQDHLSYPHRFVCITDTPEGLSQEVEAMPLPEIPLAREEWVPGMWPKVAMFKQGMFFENEFVLYLDVDIVINQSLDPFVDLIFQEKGLRIIREWNPEVWRFLPVGLRPDRGGNSSVVGFFANEQTHLFDQFIMAPNETVSKYKNDQRYITGEANHCRYWPDKWCDSFRRTCVQHWPLNLFFSRIKKPLVSKVLVFHGKPDPTDLIEEGDYRWGSTWRYGHGPVKWVQEYWQKYSKAA